MHKDTTILIKLHQVITISSKAKSTIYADMAAGKFPLPLKIGARAVAWRLSDIEDWILQQQKAQILVSSSPRKGGYGSKP